ncbi:MAG TPA: response regulator [Kofleriaceae bacterium]|jgi:CheY-like chemotaxis protein|nr:response regulator [Kofleriaceae bacterium]
MSPTEPHAAPRILLIDDDPIARQTVRWALADVGALYVASRGAEAVSLVGG